MAHKKHPFRFRIPPWLLGPTAARPATEPPPPPRRPKDGPESPPKPDTNVPIQLPWSPPSPIKTQGVTRAEPQKRSPSHPTQPISSVIIESSVTSQSEPPSQSTTPNAVTSPSPSLQTSSHAGSPSQVSIASSSPKTQPQSPSHSALDGAIMVSKLPAEESTHPATSASQQEKEKMGMSEPIPQEAEPTQHQSPSRQASDGAVVVPKPVAEESSQPASSVSEQEKEMVKSEPMPQGAEPKINSPLKAIIKSPDTFSQPENLSKQPTPILPEAPLKTQSKSPETSFQPEMISTQPSGSEPPQASSVPPPSPGSKTQPAASQPQSSSPLASKRTSKMSKPNVDESTFLASSATKEEKKMAVAVSEPVLQETEPKMKSPLKIIPKSPETSSQQKNLSIDSKAVLGDEERSKAAKAPLETQSKLLQSKEKGKVVHHQPIKAEKAKHTTGGKPVTHTIASSSGTQANDSFTRVFRADKKQLGATKTVQRKVMFATSHLSEKDIRVVSSADPGTRNVSSIFPERHVSSNEEKAPLKKGIKDDISKFVRKLATLHPTEPMNGKQSNIITLAGDNRGAIIHICSESSNKEGLIHIHHAYKTDPEESIEVTTDGEENSDNMKDSRSSTKHAEVGKAYFNSNTQSINNLMMFHASITERDPSVQVTLPQNAAEHIKSDDRLPLETHKIEFNISRAEKSNYQPMV